MYWPSLCLQLLKVKSVSERKVFIYKKTHSSNSTKMPLGSTFYYVCLLRSINSNDVGPPSPLPPSPPGGRPPHVIAIYRSQQAYMLEG